MKMKKMFFRDRDIQQYPCRCLCGESGQCGSEDNCGIVQAKAF